VKLRVKVDYKTYQKLKEVEEEYREVLEEAINYGSSYGNLREVIRRSRY